MRAFATFLTSTVNVFALFDCCKARRGYLPPTYVRQNPKRAKSSTKLRGRYKISHLTFLINHDDRYTQILPGLYACGTFCSTLKEEHFEDDRDQSVEGNTWP